MTGLSEKDRALKAALEEAFGEPIHIPLDDYLGKVLAGMFCRQPDMSGDQRERLNPKERRAVDNVASGLLAAFALLQAARSEGQGEPVALDAYDAGLLGDWGGGNVGWWHDYLRAELERAHEFYASQVTSPPTDPRIKALEWNGRVHDLKTWPEPFAAIRADLKPWEFRLNDRDYQVGDKLRLREWSPTDEAYTGEVEERLVPWVLRGGQFGVPKDFAIMSLARAALTPSDQTEKGDEHD